MSDPEIKTVKKTTEYTSVKMDDGREVSFAGARQCDKTSLIDLANGTAAVRFDFRNGKTFTLQASELTVETQLTALAHGLSQKVGDEWSGTKDVEDMALTAETIITRLKNEGWSAPREAGDSLSGASVVIRAIVEVTGKSVEQVKAFLDGKIEAAKAKGEKLSRQELYASFRNPTSKTGVVIKRLEDEKVSKGVKIDSDALLADI